MQITFRAYIRGDEAQQFLERLSQLPYNNTELSLSVEATGPIDQPVVTVAVLDPKGLIFKYFQEKHKPNIPVKLYGTPPSKK